MESAKRDKHTGSGTIISEWNPAAATTTVPACAARCPTSFVLHTAANTTSAKPGSATGHTVCRKRERERERERSWKWHADNWQWKRSRSRGARTVCFCTCTRTPDSCPAGAHVRCRPLGLARFTCDDQKCGPGSGITVGWDGPRDDGAGHAATRVCFFHFFPPSASC